MARKQDSWDSPNNEAQNNFVSWGQVGDFVYGTLVAVREVASTLPDKAGEMQKIYDFLVRECSYHTLDEKKRISEQATEPQVGDLVSVGGRKTIDSRMARVKIGQICGLKYTESLPSKIKGYSETKLIKVFTPKNPDGTVQMNQEFLDSQKDKNWDI